jgi:tRNA modification GTPase
MTLAGWQSGGEGVYIARKRHIDALQTAVGHVQQAISHDGQLELLAEELRLAQESVGAITGKYSSDELLGEIFSRFCIGK